MRKLLAALVLFGLGIGGAVIVAKPAGAQTQAVVGTLTGSVGAPGAGSSISSYVISLSSNTVPEAGAYEFDVTDYSDAHNFDLLSPSNVSIDTTPVSNPTATVTTTWTVTLADGVYKYHCDRHVSQMQGVLTVGTPQTTSTTTTTHTTTTTPTTTTTTQTTTTTPTTTTTTTTTTQTTTTQPTTTTTPPPPPLTVHITSATGTTHSVVVKVSSSRPGTAVAELMKGSKRLAKSSHAVPGKITLKPSAALKPGSYTVEVAVTAGRKHATAKKTVKVP